MSQDMSPHREGCGQDAEAWFPDRRRFVQAVVVGGLAWTAGGLVRLGAATAESPKFRGIFVDYDRCTGCRTCETVCAQNAAKRTLDGETLWGLGNPNLSNIRVYHFNPDADVPVTCVMCADAPCVQACPVAPDAQGRRAIYRDTDMGTIRTALDRCVTCGSCAKACHEKRVGAIMPNPESGKPERICTLCDGEPQCVKYCPYGALTWNNGKSDVKMQVAAPEAIARELNARWYAQGDKNGEQR